MTFMAFESTEFDSKRLLRIALTEHYLCWLAGDGEDYHQIHDKDRDGGRLAPSVLRRIAKRYNVNRGIIRPKGTKGDPSAKKLAEILTDATTELRDLEIRDRWRETRSVAEDCRQAMEDCFSGTEVKQIVSGVTKLTWFLAPRGWAMFDSFAGKAVGVGQRNKAEERAEEFYDQLSSRGFCDHVNKVQEVLNHHHFEYLFAERVIDKFLMLVGRPGVVDEWDFRAKRFIAALRQPLGDDVRSCAENVARLADSGLVQVGKGTPVSATLR